MTLDQRVAAAEANLDRLLEWVSRTDNRSLVLLTIAGAMLAAVTSLSPDPADMTWWKAVLFGLTLVPLACCIGCVAVASYPNTTGPARSLRFFGEIGGCKFDDFKKRSLAETPEEYLHDLLEQAHRNAEILCTKFRWLTRSFGALLISFAPWAAALYVFKYA